MLSQGTCAVGSRAPFRGPWCTARPRPTSALAFNNKARLQRAGHWLENLAPLAGCREVARTVPNDSVHSPKTRTTHRARHLAVHCHVLEELGHPGIEPPAAESDPDHQ